MDRGYILEEKGRWVITATVIFQSTLSHLPHVQSSFPRIGHSFSRPDPGYEGHVKSSKTRLSGQPSARRPRALLSKPLHPTLPFSGLFANVPLVISSVKIAAAVRFPPALSIQRQLPAFKRYRSIRYAIVQHGRCAASPPALCFVVCAPSAAPKTKKIECHCACFSSTPMG